MTVGNNLKNQFIVITSIFPPTKAVMDFAKQKDWQLIVAGDKKSPAEWSCEGVTYLSATDQEATDYHIAKVLPWNHYCRKMVGYVHAIKSGAEIIVDTDDDNIPNEDWAMPDFTGEYDVTKPELGFVNIYKSFTDMHIWARGLPLNYVTDKNAILNDEDLTKQQVRIGVWQGLADGDPDVDAVYRLIYNEPCYFKDRAPVVLGKNTLSPFNSQNTAYRRELFPLLYLPSYVTFRFTDILRGLVAQPIMTMMDYHLGFTKATVFQARNPHDYMKDFESEIPCYLYPEKVIETVAGAIKPSDSLADNLYNAYQSLHTQGIVPEQELPVLAAWLKDVQ